MKIHIFQNIKLEWKIWELEDMKNQAFRFEVIFTSNLSFYIIFQKWRVDRGSDLAVTEECSWKESILRPMNPKAVSKGDILRSESVVRAGEGMLDETRNPPYWSPSPLHLLFFTLQAFLFRPADACNISQRNHTASCWTVSRRK